MKIDLLSEKQAQILDFIVSGDDMLICDGAVRSGKTVIMASAFVIWAMEYYDRTNFGICGKTVQSAERNVLKPLRENESLPYSMDYKVSTRVLTVRCGDKINWFYLFGGKDESSYMLIQGITLAGVLFDEVALMPKSFVEQALARAISFERPKYWFNCNPESPNHYFYKEWIANPRPGVTHLHFLLNDNPILTERMIERTKSMYSGVFYDRYIRGLWVAAEGTIYRLFTDDPDRYTIDTAPPIQFAIIGVDFGGNGSATAFICNGITPGFREVVTLDEHYHKGVQSPQELERDFIDFVRRCQSKYRVYTAYCDSAEQTLIEGLRWAAVREHLPIEVVNAIKGPINDRIRFYSALMGADRYKIMRHCKHLKEAFQTAVWSDKDKTKDIRLDDGSRNIDSLDALEYSTEAFMQDIIPMLRR